MKKLRILALLLCLMGSAQIASAQKIGYMDFQLVMTNYPEYDSARLELAYFQNELQQKINEEMKTYNQLNSDYEKAKESGMDPELLKVKENGVKAQADVVRTNEAYAERQLQEKQVELLQKIIDQIKEFVNVVAKEKGFAYVMDNSQNMLIVKDPKGDITKAVFAKMGLKYPEEKKEAAAGE